jgi:hypothetical protein
MSAQQVIDEFKELSPAERAKVVQFVLENDDSWIPEEFKQGTDDIAAGRVMEFNEAINAMAYDSQIQNELRSTNAKFATAAPDGVRIAL